jgi:hypothetical protein
MPGNNNGHSITRVAECVGVAPSSTSTHDSVIPTFGVKHGRVVITS